MFKNATFKLTIYYLGVVMVISLVFSLVVFRIGMDNLQIGLNQQSQELSMAFPVFNGTPYGQPDPAELMAGKRHLIDELIITNIIVLIGAGIISNILARETLQPIEEMHEKQKRFTADVSHELRTPLTALKMESEVALMDSKLGKAELRKVITSNIEEIEKIDTLINNLLRLTKLEEAELQEEFKTVELSSIAGEAIDHIKVALASKQIKIVTNYQEINVYGDHDSLVQMLVIFLDNAIKYSNIASEIDISTTSKNNQSMIIIKDHGQGIASKDLDHIFGRFYRADEARSGSSGYGLGLSIAKLIADVHGANIAIASSLNNGTEVSVQFASSSKS